MAFILDQSYTTGQDNGTGTGIGNLRRGTNNNEILGQSFTPTLTGPLNRVELYLKKEGSPTGNMWAEIHVDGADPSAASQVGSDSAMVDVSTVSGAGFAYYAFDFASPITLTPGTEYWVLLYGDYALAIDVGVYWGTDTSSPGYAGGIAGRYGNGSAAWEDESPYDRLFKEYSDEVPATGFFHISL